MHLPRTIRAATLLALPCLAQAVDFATEVHPILAARCAPCHSGTKPAAGLSLTSRELMLDPKTAQPVKDAMLAMHLSDLRSLIANTLNASQGVSQ